MKIITVQPSDHVDQLAADGTELTQRPYPFHIRAVDGRVIGPLWRNNPQRAVGFAARLDREQIDLWWRDVAADPQRVVGMYLVTEATDHGGMAVHQCAIQSVKVIEVEGDPE